MPCSSDWSEPGGRFNPDGKLGTWDQVDPRIAETRTVGNHLVYIYDKLGHTAFKRTMVNALTRSNSSDNLDNWTALLCRTLHELSLEDTERIVYNAKDSCSRKLADWWEDHQEWDKRREAKEAEELAAKKKEHARLRASIINIEKLAPGQQQAVFEAMGIQE